MPPTAVHAATFDPVAETPTGFEMLIEVVVAPGASVNWTLATTPAANALVFGPLSRQVSKPGVEAHARVFPAAEAAGPAAAPIARI